MSTCQTTTKKINPITDLCPFSGKEVDALYSHITKILTDSGWKYSCTLCGKDNVQKSNVLKHVESVHFPNMFTYQCKFCEKQFSARNSLYAHVSRNHKNWIYFIKTSTIFSALEFDPKMISDYLEKCPDYGPKAYQCTVCGKVNSDKSSASKHVENIHMQGVFTYSCKHCGKTFGSRNNMYAHISRTHKNS